MWLKCKLLSETAKGHLCVLLDNGQSQIIPKSLIYAKKKNHIDVVDWFYDKIITEQFENE